jgi:hypothetical protein
MKDVGKWAKVRDKSVGKLLKEIDDLFSKTEKTLKDTKTEIEQNEDSFEQKINAVKLKYRIQ